MDESISLAPSPQANGVDGLAVAKHLAAQGFKVFPVKRNGKAPANRKGFKPASSDPADWHDETGQWWTGSHAGDNVGIACGPYPDGRYLVVIDLDRHDGGADGVEAWRTKATEHDDFETLIVATPNEGAHVYFWSEFEIASGAGPAPGIDIKAAGGYVLSQGSALPTGVYEVVLTKPISPIPGWVMGWIESSRGEPTEVRAPRPAAAARQMSTPRTGNSPTDEWAARTDWADLLEPDGWTLHHTDGNGERHWTRPGKEARDGTSATTGFTGRDNMKVFTSSHPKLVAGETYTKFGYLAATKHGGDYKAAAASLRDNSTDNFKRKTGSDLGMLVDNSMDTTGANGTRVDPATGEILEQLAPDQEPEEQADFWASRPELTQVRDVALASIVSPWAVLATSMTRVLAAVPPSVVLPPVANGSGFGSLNLLLALVGPSGSGKGMAMRAGEDVFDIPAFNNEFRMGADRIVTRSPLSGQAIAHCFVKVEGGEPVRKANSVILHYEEIDSLLGSSQQRGSIILPELRHLGMGEQLGAQYVDEAKTVVVDAHTYRAVLVAGVQPGRSAVLLNDDAGGTPQRFVWMPTVWPYHAEETPLRPPPLKWVCPDLIGARQHVMSIAAAVAEEIRVEHLERANGRGVTLDGHATLIRLRVAAGLALMAGRMNVDEEDWRLADVVMGVSDQTRWICGDALAGDKRKATAAKAIEASVVELKVDADREANREARMMEGTAARVLTILSRANGEWMRKREIQNGLSKLQRDWLGPVLDDLVARREIEERIDGGSHGPLGAQYRALPPCG